MDMRRIGRCYWDSARYLISKRFMYHALMTSYILLIDAAWMGERKIKEKNTNRIRVV
jgi:hypothetical protein